MFILQSISSDDLTSKISEESEKQETRKEKVLRWADSIDMARALAPSVGSRIL
ncbi:hypothetical protein NEMIN01_0897 [Nematocida minor]|uniref:uncharacterized protein n=1 Tax=Nematocida minor TaxID=1912983 RepID=UPI00221EC6EA|nr:uncharacterized protein NEMIN01_0897 [Nematocida minor]KAI5190198.1 hypothetical protein NEMIN01_0897 [Nematocida minor]